MFRTERLQCFCFRGSPQLRGTLLAEGSSNGSGALPARRLQLQASTCAPLPLGKGLVLVTTTVACLYDPTASKIYFGVSTSARSRNQIPRSSSSVGSKIVS